MPAVHDEAVCIRQWDWSETSQTVSVFCRVLGLVKALAKGSRRPKAPYSGGVELLTQARAGVLVRPNTELALLTEWDLQETFPALRRSLDAHHTGLYMADLVQHALHGPDPHPGLYDTLLECLRALEAEDQRAGALLRFQWAVLAETGYKPSLDVDVGTGEALGENAAYRFSPSLGGLLADSGPVAPESGRGAGGAATWRVRAETVRILRGAAGDSGNTPPLSRGAPEAMERANRLLAAYLRHVLGREPRTLPLVFGPRLPR